MSNDQSNEHMRWPLGTPMRVLTRVLPARANNKTRRVLTAAIIIALQQGPPVRASIYIYTSGDHRNTSVRERMLLPLVLLSPLFFVFRTVYGAFSS